MKNVIIIANKSIKDVSPIVATTITITMIKKTTRRQWFGSLWQSLLANIAIFRWQCTATPALVEPESSQPATSSTTSGASFTSYTPDTVSVLASNTWPSSSETSCTYFYIFQCPLSNGPHALLSDLYFDCIKQYNSNAPFSFSFITSRNTKHNVFIAGIFHHLICMKISGYGVTMQSDMCG